jgi:hypothetical protein
LGVFYLVCTDSSVRTVGYCTYMYKSERVELRLSPREVEILDSVRGSASRSAWLRNQIAHAERADQTPLPSQLAPVIPDPIAVAAGEKVPHVSQILGTLSAETVSTDKPPVHRHRRGAIISTGHHRGQTINTYVCAVEGCDYQMGD